MNHHTLHGAIPVLWCIAFILFAVGCEYTGEHPVPIFSDTEHMAARIDENDYLFFPSEEVEYIVIGLFNSPIATSGKSITNMDDMEGGSCTGQTGFTRSSVPMDSLYVFDQTSKFFTGSPGDYMPSGTRYWAVWGFNADWVIISSSEEIETDFP